MLKPSRLRSLICSTSFPLNNGRPSSVSRFERFITSEGVAHFSTGIMGIFAPALTFFAYYAPDELAGFLERAGFSIDHCWISEDTLPSRRQICWVNIIDHRGRLAPDSTSDDNVTVCLAKRFSATQQIIRAQKRSSAAS